MLSFQSIIEMLILSLSFFNIEVCYHDISSMRTYLVEVHGTLLQTLANLMNDYSTNLLLYKDGYYQIDSYLHTKLPGKEFTRLHSDLKGSRDKLKIEIERQGYYEIKNPRVYKPGTTEIVSVEGIFRINQWSK